MKHITVEKIQEFKQVFYMQSMIIMVDNLKDERK
jgi:hypothetical protein